MKFSELRSILSANPENFLRFVLPDGDAIPSQFHVTEVGYVSKRFIDCGGTARNTAGVQLQLWLGSDSEHRLTAGKLAKILSLAREVVPSDDLDVDVEYEACTISQYPIVTAASKDGVIEFTLTGRHTDCLAKQACDCAPAEPVEAQACCGGSSCCA
ncbi:MAG: DUF6428 family protein [Verrucomicrobiota bacterium]